MPDGWREQVQAALPTRRRRSPDRPEIPHESPEDRAARLAQARAELDALRQQQATADPPSEATT